MAIFLLAIIAGCLLFGGAAVLGFVEGAFWIIIVIGLLVLAIGIIRACVLGVGHLIGRVALGLRSAWRKKFPPRSSFRDRQDYLDWANREGRWREERPDAEMHVALKRPPKIDGVKFVDWQDYQDWAVREGRWGQKGGDKTER
jgi:hypothetical protein